MLYRFECSNCDYLQNIAYLPRVYQLPDGNARWMSQVHFWCSTCESISVAEALGELECERRCHRDALRTAERVHDSGQYSQVRFESLEAFQQYQKEWIDQLYLRSAEQEIWLERFADSRRAPQRCLRCGNPDGEFPNEQCFPLAHGGCGGELMPHFELAGALFKSSTSRPHVYDLQGNLIVQGRMSSDEDSEEMPLWWPDEWTSWRPL